MEVSLGEPANIAATSESVVDLKNKGNICFKNGSYDDAAEYYSLAIEKEPSAILFGNRSQCYLKKELYGLALSDAAEAIGLDNTYVKAFFRRASAYMALGRFQKALRDYEAVCKSHPNDKDSVRLRDECRKHVRRIAFEKAISVDHNKQPITERIILDNMVVEDGYDGPRLDGPITADFMRELIVTFKAQKKLHIRYAFAMMLDFYTYMQKQPNMVEIEIEGDQEFTVCGDVHGQFYDLCNIFDLRGMPSETNPFLFNGDFVDRGSFSVETIFTLIGFKLLYPDYFFLARGNHESSVMNSMYGFEGEVKAKYNSLMGEFFTEIFCYLPLCHLINRKVFVCHGGLFANDNITLADILKVDRVRQPPDQGIMCDLLWSDPMDQCGRSPSKRGVGTQFGPDVTASWCLENGVDYVIRSHEVKPEGFEEQAGGKCFTLFSAPNYCDSVGNQGAYAIISAKKLKPKFVSFSAVDHPPVPAMRYASGLFGL